MIHARNHERTFLQKVLRSGVPAAALFFCAVTNAPDASACGGCFHSANDVGGSIVTDHRMVFEITAQETILWDQVRYSGDPAEFAWVLPVRAGARVELSSGEWIAALDAATRSTVAGPTVTCPARPSNATSSSGQSSRQGQSTSSSSGGGGGGGGGCGGGGYSSATETASAAGGGSTDDSSNGSAYTPKFSGNDDVEVVAQSSIGPYQAVTIRASGSTGISDWLKTNGFAIPSSIVPVIDGYIAAKLDFIALRLRPNQGTQAMRPIRIVSPGADTTLPLRMVAAGVGAKVGLTLWVIGEGRYHTQNFPDAAVDWSALAWNATQGRSNRTELEAAALATNGGRSWITEAAIRTSFRSAALGSGLPTVFDAYTQQCKFRPSHAVKCDDGALPPPDGRPGDLQPDGGVDPDGGASDDGGADAGECVKYVKGCDGFDDLDVASRSLHGADAWVTRLRADLPVSALTTDLRLEASPDQVELSPAHKTSIFNPPFDPCAAPRSAPPPPPSYTPPPRSDGGDGCTCRTVPLQADLGTWALIGITMIALPLAARRRRRR